MSELVIRGLRAVIANTDNEILRGIDLTIRSGEVHAIMGPNGAGKSTLSHVLLGKPGYEVTGGTVELDGVDVLELETWQRAQAGLFLGMQYPTEVPGVSLNDMLAASFAASDRSSGGLDSMIRTEADRIGFDHKFLDRPLNVDLSGGEKKRNETLQLGVLQPKIAILDELDSGLDVDALRMVSQRVEAATEEDQLGVLVITHYSRLLEELRPDHVHVLAKGQIVKSGGAGLADELEKTGYGEFVSDDDSDDSGKRNLAEGETFADMFADPLA